MNVVTALAAFTLAGLAALAPTALGPAATDAPNCQTVDGVGFVCVDADTDCTDGSCGATVDGEVGVAATDAPNCQTVDGVGTACAEATPEGGSVDVVAGVDGVGSAEAHATYGIGL